MTPTITPDLAERILRAAEWLDHGAPVWTSPDGGMVDLIPRIRYERLGDLWAGIAAERSDHTEQAARSAAARTGATWGAATFLSLPAIAADVLATSEYARLEAGARERRILAFAACLSPAT